MSVEETERRGREVDAFRDLRDWRSAQQIPVLRISQR